MVRVEPIITDKRRSPHRILIIDDDAHFRSVVRQMLERSNMEVLEAADGAAGVECLRANEIDLVLTDLIMPEKDGIMAIQEILEQYPSLKVIAMSGGPRGNSAWLPIARRVGALRTLRKPFSSNELLDAVSSLLANG